MHLTRATRVCRKDKRGKESMYFSSRGILHTNSICMPMDKPYGWCASVFNIIRRSMQHWLSWLFFGIHLHAWCVCTHGSGSSSRGAYHPR